MDPNTTGYANLVHIVLFPSEMIGKDLKRERLVRRKD